MRVCPQGVCPQQFVSFARRDCIICPKGLYLLPEGIVSLPEVIVSFARGEVVLP